MQAPPLTPLALYVCGRPWAAAHLPLQSGWTALHAVAYDGKDAAAVLLVELGASTTKKDNVRPSMQAAPSLTQHTERPNTRRLGTPLQARRDGGGN